MMNRKELTFTAAPAVEFVDLRSADTKPETDTRVAFAYCVTLAVLVLMALVTFVGVALNAAALPVAAGLGSVILVPFMAFQVLAAKLTR